MFPRVTAILVVQHGGDHLRRTLDALQAQRRTPDALVIVLTDADAGAREIVDGAGATHIVEHSQHLSFGDAVRAGERVLEAPSTDADALWLLSEDSAPEPEALATLLATLETAKSVGIAGPKLMHWDAPDRIAVFGRSVTRLGRSVPLVADELDQGQHDGLSDVLGLDPAAILVRHTLWRSLDGFDPGLPSADDALDFSIRARLAGHRVAVVPDARVAFAGVGVAGLPVARRPRTVRRRGRAARAAELHRRLVYAPAPAVPLHWLSLLPLALLRSIRLLLVKTPGAIPGELAAAIRTMFSGMRVARARRTLKSGRTSGWAVVAPLRMQHDEMRRRRQLAAEARLARARGRKHELQFLSTGGGWVLLTSAVASVALFSWLMSANGIRGGGLLPLSSGLDALWRNAAYGWRDLGTGLVGAADPFAGLLAVIGSITFWAPSFGLVLLWLVAVPAAAIGAWFAASRLTERGGVRAVAALVWAVSPPFLTALGDGRPGAVIAHVLLGWLAFAVFGAATSWAAAAAASLLFAAVVAAAPSLAPALLVAWLVGLAVSGRAAARLAGLPIPAAVLAAPLVYEQFARGTPLALLADPGAPVVSAVPSAWQLALGFPGAPSAAWNEVIGAIASVDPRLVVAALLAPLALAALAAVLAPGVRAALLALGTALLGFATAVVAAQLAVAMVGPAAVPVWTGAGLSLEWLGLTLAAVVALGSLRRGSALVGGFVTVCAVVAVLPTAFAIATGTAAVTPAAERILPAFIAAEAEADPRVATLRIEPEADGGLRATLEHGAGATLDEQSTLVQTNEVLGADDQELATIAGNLASRSGFDPTAAAREFGVSFVLLAAPADDENRDAVATADRARTALDGNAALVAVGETAFGTLWRFAAAEPDAEAARIPAGAGGWLTGVITLVQLVVIGAALLLSIPTGAGRETDRRPVRRRPIRRRRGSPAARAAAGVATAEVAAAHEATPDDAAADDATAADANEDEPAPDDATEDEPAPADANEDEPAPDDATEDEPAPDDATPAEPAADGAAHATADEVGEAEELDGPEAPASDEAVPIDGEVTGPGEAVPVDPGGIMLPTDAADPDGDDDAR